ncbi:MAG: winged helix-turn-helix domain-containing protein [Candidatus Bathyarchaeota archaeon]|nr:winged helix-turn-helix domain-containing protein [Candidatus Bathyarchaeota archaeon]
MHHKKAQGQMENVNYRFIGRKTDPNILPLFPSLNFCTADTQAEKNAALQRLSCLYILGNCNSAPVSKLTDALKIPRPAVMKALKKLLSQGLIESAKTGKPVGYMLSTKGLVASVAFREFQEWTKMQVALSAPKKRNDPLAYALLTVGYAASSKPDAVYSALCRYASQGHNLEQVNAEVAAESLLNFYRAEMRSCGDAPASYLGVFKEFTTTGFQDVFRMLLMAIKPTAEDYNWLVEFFNQVAEFYYDPSRVAYVNLLKENKNLQAALEEFKKNQDQLIKKEGKNLEVTFTVPSAGLQKIDSMPPHLRAMGMRLMLEPMKFVNKELCRFFWEDKKEG